MDFMQQIERNYLSTWITAEMRARPHYIEVEEWNIIKEILKQIRFCMVDVVRNNNDKKELNMSVNRSIKEIDKIKDPLYKRLCDEYVWELLDWYIAKAEKDELFETCSNLTILRDVLCVRIEKSSN